MKKLVIIFLLAGLMFFPGCGSVEISDDTQDVLIQISARRLGYHGGQAYPVIIQPGIAFCKAAIHLNAGEIGPAFEDAITWMESELGDDPLLAEDLESVLSLIDFDPSVVVDPVTLHKIRVGLLAFRSGLMAASQGP